MPSTSTIRPAAAIFRGLPEAAATNQLYQVIMATARDLADQWPDTHAALEASFRQSSQFFDEGRIDEAKLLQYRAKH
jgi:hypothetical protein